MCPLVDYSNYFDVELADSGESLPEDSIRLAHNIGRQSAIGVKVLIEGRDNRLNGKSGYFIDASFRVFDDAIGSEYNYTFFKADLRYYITPNKNLTIASQLRTESKNGDVPVQSLALMGGDYSMRGIYRGRFRDNVAVDMQTELRFPVFWILGATVFGGLGQVAPEYGALQMNQFHYVYGAGLRLKVDSKHDVNLRFDIGFSEDQTIFIMNFAEVF